MMTILNLRAGYLNHPVLKNISFSAESGELTVLIGPNGSGKSTLLKAMARLLKPERGEILLNGENLRAFPGKKLAQNIAFLPQNRDVPELSVYDLALCGRYPHLRFPGRATAADREAALRALEQAGVSALADRSLSGLSGGERQRAYIAMLLSQEARTLLLDEPTAHLDINARLQLLDLIKNLRSGGRTLVVVLHELDEALMIADKIALLSGGDLKFFGPPEALTQTSALDEAFQIKTHAHKGESGRARYYFTKRE